MEDQADWEVRLKDISGTEVFQKIKTAQKRFSEYKSTALLKKMYSLILGSGGIYEVNIPRRNRLETIAQLLDEYIPPSQSVLDWGAGSGLLSLAIQRKLNPENYWVWDICPDFQYHLESLGFKWDEGGQGLDLVLCLDSLGECNSDEDQSLKNALMEKRPEGGELIESHYGFLEKITPLLERLLPNGQLFLIEPIYMDVFWESLRNFLSIRGLNAHFIRDSDGLKGIFLIK